MLSLAQSALATERGRSRFVSVVVALMLALAAPRLYAQVRVAVVDMQRALLETGEGRCAKNQLKARFESRQDALNTRQESLKHLKEDIEKQKNVVSREALQKRMDEYQKAFVDLQQTYLEYQNELAQKEAELTKSILVNLQTIVRQIGTAEGYTAILDQGAVVWAPTHLDLTDRAIQEYNAAHPPPPNCGAPAAGVTPPAGGAHPTTPAANPHPATPAANPHPRGEQPH